ncbi:hypothetical protein Hanom_Chr16g01430221 [Helianthus anomalus]
MSFVLRGAAQWLEWGKCCSPYGGSSNPGPTLLYPFELALALSPLNVSL